MKQNIPFSQMLSSSSNLAVILYIECPQAWMRGKREIAMGWPVLLLPKDMHVSQARFPVAQKEVLITDLIGISNHRAESIGAAVLEAGALAAIYLGPNNRSILFLPEVVSWIA